MTPEEKLLAKVQRPSSLEELGALVEGDFIRENKLGFLMYTEQNNKKRFIRQLDQFAILLVDLKKSRTSEYKINSDGTMDLQIGVTIPVLGDRCWPEYSVNQNLLLKGDFYRLEELVNGRPTEALTLNENQPYCGPTNSVADVRRVS